MRNIISIVFIANLFLLSCNQSKIIQENYPNGNTKETYSLSGKKYHGQFKTYYENGKVWAIGNFNRNLMDGEWAYYYDNEKIMSKQTFNKGKLTNINVWDKNGNWTIKNGTGIALIYYPDGDKISEVSYKECIRDGKWTSWFENGHKESEIYFNKGKPEGKWTFWNINGEIEKIEIYEEGKLKEPLK